MNSHVDPQLLDPPNVQKEGETVEREVLATALDLILTFARGLIADPLDIEVRDERELPAPKETLVHCFALILMTETRPDWRRAFYDTGLKLAYFWPGIGPGRLKLPANVFDQVLAIDRSQDLLREDLLQNEEEIRAFSAAFSKVQEEQARIAAVLDRSIESLVSVTDQLSD